MVCKFYFAIYLVQSMACSNMILVFERSTILLPFHLCVLALPRDAKNLSKRKREK